MGIMEETRAKADFAGGRGAGRGIGLGWLGLKPRFPAAVPSASDLSLESRHLAARHQRQQMHGPRMGSVSLEIQSNSHYPVVANIVLPATGEVSKSSFRVVVRPWALVADASRKRGPGVRMGQNGTVETCCGCAEIAGRVEGPGGRRAVIRRPGPDSGSAALVQRRCGSSAYIGKFKVKIQSSREDQRSKLQGGKNVQRRRLNAQCWMIERFGEGARRRGATGVGRRCRAAVLGHSSRLTLESATAAAG